MADPLIVSDPAVMLGKPVVAGTRLTVELILRKLGAGETVDQLLDSHPRLTREAVFAALREVHSGRLAGQSAGPATLAGLLAGITPGNLHGEWAAGPPAGAERL